MAADPRQRHRRTRVRTPPVDRGSEPWPVRRSPTCCSRRVPGLSTARGSANRGVEIQRVKLACTLPGESVATYGDALNRLTDRSSYLYVEGARYWYGTQASVARRVRELVEQLLTTRRDEVHAEIVRRLRDQARERGEFVAVHVCPTAPERFPTTQMRALSSLARQPRTPTETTTHRRWSAREILDQRLWPRLYRNMLVFLAPDLKRLEELERGSAEFLAWKEIEDRRQD